jgi:nucleoside-diphosphate-sugar epimerase
MKIVVIGGTGLIGSKTVAILREGGHEVVAASVVSDPEARFFGGRVEQHSLVPLGEARLGRIGFDAWLRRAQAAA